MLDLTLSWAFRHGKFLVHRSEMTLVGSCLKYLKTYLVDYEDENAKIAKDIEEILLNTSLFCVVWSVGASLEEMSRKPFHEFVVKMISGDGDLVKKYDLR